MAKRIELWPLERLVPYARNADEKDNRAIEWRPVPAHPAYEVSERGEVRRTFTFRHYRAGMLLKQKPNRTGYMVVTLSTDGERRDVFAHRLVALAFVGPPPTAKHQVAHGDGNPKNNRWQNLRWATASENALDRRSHGTVPDRKGEKHPMARLTDELVFAMRRRRGEGAYFREIAKEFGIPKLTVYDAVTGKTWGHI